MCKTQGRSWCVICFLPKNARTPARILRVTDSAPPEVVADDEARVNADDLRKSRSRQEVAIGDNSFAGRSFAPRWPRDRRYQASLGAREVNDPRRRETRSIDGYKSGAGSWRNLNFPPASSKETRSFSWMEGTAGWGKEKKESALEKGGRERGRGRERPGERKACGCGRMRRGQRKEIMQTAANSIEVHCK